MEISILGGGSWGTAMAKELSKKYNILMYIRNEKSRDEINNNHKNDRYLVDYLLPENIKATSDISQALNNKYVIPPIHIKPITGTRKNAINTEKSKAIIRYITFSSFMYL